MSYYSFVIDDSTIIQIKLLAMYFSEEQRKIAERENLPEMAHVWTETDVIESLVRDQMGALSDDGVDFDKYYHELEDRGIVDKGNLI